MQSYVTIKGVDDKLEINFDERASYTMLREELISKLSKHKSFFKNAKTKVIISGRALSTAQRNEIKRIFKMDYDLTRVFYADEMNQYKSAPVVFDATPKNTAQKEEESFEDFSRQQVSLVSNAYFDAKSIFVSTTVRSGQRIECEGDIVVIGDVNPGAEIIAGGSIAVFGKLRGLAHAGASGREDVCVAALYMQPKQLRLSGRVVIPEQRKDAVIGEVAELKNDSVVIRPISGTNR